MPAQFKKIATGQNHRTKSGRACIKMTIDQSALGKVPTYTDVFVFKDVKDGQTEYTMMAQVDSSIMTAEKLDMMEPDELNAFFMTWITSPQGEDAIKAIKES